VNEFIKRQTPETRRAILLGMESHLLSHLSPDLFAEARRLRPPQVRRGRGRAAANAVIFPPRAPHIDPPPREPIRDSESEDLSVQMLSRVNLHPDALIGNMHEYMKDNVENLKELDVRDSLSTLKDREPVRTNADLEAFVNSLLTSQFASGDLHAIEPMTELFVVELLSAGLGIGFKKVDIKDEMKKLAPLVGVPSFRLGLTVKLTQLMQAEMAALTAHIKERRERFNTWISVPPFKFGAKMFTSGGRVAPKDAISGYLAFMEELQMLPAHNGQTQVWDLLDLLKSPETDASLRAMLGEDQKGSLLDMILQIVVDYLVLLGSCPQAIDPGASDKEFDAWRQGVLRSLHTIVEQINFHLGRLERMLERKRKEENGEQKVRSLVAKYGLHTRSFNEQTLRHLLAIVFFAEQSNASTGVRAATTRHSPPSILPSKRTQQRLQSLLNLLLQLRMQTQTEEQSQDGARPEPQLVHIAATLEKFATSSPQ
jgi:hypothetical protein